MANCRKSIADIRSLKEKGDKVVCLTAYSAPMASLLDPHVDLLLVGDSLGMVLYGFDNTVPVTLEMMIAHGAAVVRASRKAFVVVDMPFGSYQASPQQAYGNAVKVIQQTGCNAVKIEGGVEMVPTIEFLTERGVAVMGHVGLMPQHSQAIGGFLKEGNTAKVTEDALAVEKAGAFAIVLECISRDNAAEVSLKLSIPTIGIGAGVDCDGQVLVTEDMVGLGVGPVPSFVKRYASLNDTLEKAVENYAQDIRQSGQQG